MNLEKRDITTMKLEKNVITFRTTVVSLFHKLRLQGGYIKDEVLTFENEIDAHTYFNAISVEISGDVDKTAIDEISKISRMKPVSEYIEFDTPSNNIFRIGEIYSWINEKDEAEKGELLSINGDRLKFKITK